MNKEQKEIIEEAKRLCDLGLSTHEINTEQEPAFTPVEYYVHLLRLVGKLLDKAKDDQFSKKTAIGAERAERKKG